MHLQTSDQDVMVMGIGTYTCNWGTHLCGLYETEQERDEIVFGFLRQGFSDGDMQLYCPVERSTPQFVRDFGAACPECQNMLHSDQHFSALTAEELYYPDGIFDPWHMDDSLNAFYVRSQRQGPRHVRASAEMSWATSAIPGVDYLMAYEARLNYFIPGKRWISICMYNIAKFSGALVMNVLQTHPYTIHDGVITQNPYFEHPDTWLARNAPQFLPSAPRA